MHRPYQSAIVAAVVLSGAAAALLYFAARVPAWAALLLAVNTATFAMYAWDKRAAGRGSARTPEAVLHVLALLGGSPAALAGQQLLRHKTRKAAFQFVFWLIVAAQVAAILLAWRAGFLPLRNTAA